MQMQYLRQENVLILTPIEELSMVFVSSQDSPESLCGAWKDERTAEEIVEDIYKTRLISSPKKPEL